MSISCECDIDYFPEPGDKVYSSPDDYSVLSTNRRKRCVSCSDLIDVGATCAIFRRGKIAEDEIEERIYGEGEEVPIASHYMCEPCADIYFSISELGYCFNIGDMRKTLKEYHELKLEEKTWKENK